MGGGERKGEGEGEGEGWGKIEKTREGEREGESAHVREGGGERKRAVKIDATEIKNSCDVCACGRIIKM